MQDLSLFDFSAANNNNSSVDPYQYCNKLTCRHWVAQHPITGAANDLHSSTFISHEIQQALEGQTEK